MPVGTAKVEKGDMPVLLNALGTVNIDATGAVVSENFSSIHAGPDNDFALSLTNTPQGLGSAPVDAAFPSTFYVRFTSDGTTVRAQRSADGQTWTNTGNATNLNGLTNPKIMIFYPEEVAKVISAITKAVEIGSDLAAKAVPI